MRSNSLKRRRASEISYQAIRKPLQSPAKTPASPTDISYNYLEDLEQLYHAEVEFIVAEDCWKVLKVLLLMVMAKFQGSKLQRQDCLR
jgi:hypothetical protein